MQPLSDDFIINWYKEADVVDGGSLLSRSRVELRSQAHAHPLHRYEVYEQVPKFLHKWRGHRQVLTTHLGADPFPPPSGRYHSAPWDLPAPDKIDGKRTFVAKAGDSPLSSEVSSVEMVAKSMRLGKDRTVGGPIEASAFHTGLKLPTIRGEKVTEIVFEFHPPQDPWVEVEVLQAASARRHMALLEEQWLSHQSLSSSPVSPERLMTSDNLPQDTSVYFVDQLVGDATLTCEIGPDNPLTLLIEVGYIADLRAALSVQVRGLSSDIVATTEPLFFTGVQGRIVVTDLTTGLLSDESLRLLQDYERERGSVEELASGYDLDVTTLEERLQAAVEELGAASLEDAVALASTATPQLMSV